MGRERIQRDDDVWPQRFFVLDLIDAEIASGKDSTWLAKQFGLPTDYSFRLGWRYHYDRRPDLDAIEAMAEYFKLPISAIYNPKSAIAPKDELALAKEALAGAMGSDALSSLSDEKILAAYRVAIAAAKATLAQ